MCGPLGLALAGGRLLGLPSGPLLGLAERGGAALGGLALGFGGGALGLLGSPGGLVAEAAQLVDALLELGPSCRLGLGAGLGLAQARLELSPRPRRRLRARFGLGETLFASGLVV